MGLTVGAPKGRREKPLVVPRRGGHHLLFLSILPIVVLMGFR